MATTTIRPSGLRISLPVTLQITEPVARKSSRGRLRGDLPSGPEPVESAGTGSGAGSVASQLLISAFQRDGMELVDSFTLEATGAVPAVTRRRAAQADAAEIALNLPEDENAVILLEQDGLYAWKFPAEKSAGVSRRKRGPAVARSLTFRIEMPPAGGAPKRGAARRGLLSDFFENTVRAFVLKFAAGVTVKAAMKYLERNISQGIVTVGSTDTKRWLPIDDASSLRLPLDRRPRVLLLVHGTFSSTIGCFGPLAATDDGKQFLKRIFAMYDAVIAYDHSTLGTDPAANAADLFKRLRNFGWSQPPIFDVITHSRGALVVREMAERLAPQSKWRPAFERLIFVGATNGGTQLAEPDNWGTLIDLYTNLVVGTCRAIGLMPQAKAVTAVLAEVAKGLGAFIKYCATYAVTEQGVPGLAAMEPDSALVERINRNIPAGAAAEYYTITADFKPDLLGGQPKEFPARLLTWLANGVVDNLMKKMANDLVVDTPSMTAMEKSSKGIITARLDIPTGPGVYHTNYFSTPEVVAALGEWLGLSGELSGSAVTKRRINRTTETASRSRIAEEKSSSKKSRRPVSEPLDVEEKNILLLEKAKVLVPVISHQRAFKKISPTRRLRGLSEISQSFDLDLVADGDASFQVGSGGGSGEGGRRVRMGGTSGRRQIIDRITRAAAKPAKHSSAKKSPAKKSSMKKSPPEKSPAKKSSAKRTSSRKAGGDVPSDIDTKVLCHFHATIDEEVEVDRVTAVEVLISREAIERAISDSSQKGDAKVDPEKKLVLEVLPLQNFQVVGEGRRELDPPAPGSRELQVFNLLATHGGEGRIWVMVSQERTSLLTLELKCSIVTKRESSKKKVTAEADAVATESIPQDVDILRIFQMRNGGELHYRCDFYSTHLGVMESHDSNTIEMDPGEYVANIFKQVEDRWIGKKNDVEGFQQDLRAYGGELFDQLFSPEMRRILWDARMGLKNIMVISSEPFIPWELVHLKNPDKRGLPKETLFLGQLGLMRWIQNIRFPSTELNISKGSARYVIPDYPVTKYVLPEATEEREFLKQKFGATPLQAEPNAVRDALTTDNAFDLLHFAGHGQADQTDIANAVLMMAGRVEDGNYIPEYLNATTVAQFSDFSGWKNRPMVVLNACQVGRPGYRLTGMGGFAEAFVGGGAAVFVGTLWSVGDSPARNFTETLYEKLLDGSTLAEATIAAREAARKAGDATWLAYVVYGIPHAKLKHV